MKTVSFIIANAKNVFLKKWSLASGRVHSRPYQISIEVNERCNARCLMCDCWKEKTDYLTAPEIEAVLMELKSWLGAGVFVQISGGEPLVFRDVDRLFRVCREQNLICKISTNGIALNEKICDRIISSGLKYLTVSLDSHIPEIHDKYRGVKGTFDRAVRGLAYLRQNSSMVLGISAIIMKENVPVLREMTEFFLGLDIDRVIFQPVRAYGMKVNEWKKYPYWVHDIEALKRGIAAIKEAKKKDPRIINTTGHLDMIIDYFRDPLSIVNRRTCALGYEHLEINFRGDVFLCNAYPSIGNIKEKSVREMWISPLAEEVRKRMKTCSLPCTSNCKTEISFKEKIDKFIVFLKAGLFE